MPVKSSGSHVSGHLLSIVAASLLVEHIQAFLPSFQKLSARTGTVFNSVTGIPMSEEISGMLLVSAVLISVWGIGYHYYAG